MPNKRVHYSKVSEDELVPEASTSEETKEAVEGLVSKIYEWAYSVRIIHGEWPEVGGADLLRGFMQWLRRDRARQASARPHAQQWPSAQTSHQPGTCWCGFLSRSEKAELAKERRISDGDSVLQLPPTPDPASTLPKKCLSKLEYDATYCPCGCEGPSCKYDTHQ